MSAAHGLRAFRLRGRGGPRSPTAVQERASVEPATLGCRLMLAALVVASGLTLLGTARAAGPADAAAPSLEIAQHGSRWTMRIEKTPLAEALRAIAARAGFKLRLRGDLATPVTTTLTDVPLDEGIKRLARGNSLCLLYDSPAAAAGPATGKLTEVLVIESAPVARAPAPVDPQQRVSRLRTVRVLGLRRDPASSAALARIVVEDSDPVVRGRAALALARVRSAGGDAALIQALRGDADVQVRRAAALALGRIRTEDARRALEVATADPDLSVRSAATGALGGWASR